MIKFILYLSFLLEQLVFDPNLYTIFTSLQNFNDEGILRTDLFDNDILDVAVDSNGTAYISDHYSIYRIRAEKLNVEIFVGNGKTNQKYVEGYGEDVGFGSLESIAVNSEGILFATDNFFKVIWMISPDGKAKILTGGYGTGHLDGPIAIAKFSYLRGLFIAPDDSIYFTDMHRIKKISSLDTVTTFAGLDVFGSRDGESSKASFFNPYDITMDPRTGNIIVADTDNNLIRSINSSGYVETIAGTGVEGFYDGNATTAMFAHPASLVVDSNGFIYVSDTGTRRIRRISADHSIVVTVAGDGVPLFFNGIGKDSSISYSHGMTLATDGLIYIVDKGNFAIRLYNPSSNYLSTLAQSAKFGITDGVGSFARFKKPLALASDINGDLYVSDKGNSAIRRVFRNGNVKTYAGISGISGYYDASVIDAKFKQPQGLTFDKSGNYLYIVDTGNIRLRKIDQRNMVTSLVPADFDQLVKSPLYITKGFEIDILYFSDFSGNRIWRVNTTSNEMEPWVGIGISGYSNGARQAAMISLPQGLCVDPYGALWFTDNRCLIRKIGSDGNVMLVAGLPDQRGFLDGLGHNARFSYIMGLDCGKNGDIYVADQGNNAIRKITQSGSVSTVAGGPLKIGILDGTVTKALFNRPTGVLVHPDDGCLYAVDSDNNSVRKINFTAGDSIVTTIAGAGASSSPPTSNHEIVDRIVKPFDFAINPVTRDICVSDTGNNRILIFDKNLKSLRAYSGWGSIGWLDMMEDILSAQFNKPHGISFSPDGQSLFVADTYNHVIRRITANSGEQGKVETVAGNGIAGFTNGKAMNSSFNHPKMVICNKNGDLFIADTMNNVIRKVNLMSGVVSTAAGTGSYGFKDGHAIRAAWFKRPVAMVFAFKETCLIIAEHQNHAIRLWNITSNLVRTIAGTGIPGFQNGKVNESTFRNPSGLAYDDDKRLLYVSDFGNDAIRIIDLNTEEYNVSTLYHAGGTIRITSDFSLHEPTGLLLITEKKSLLVLEAGKNKIHIIGDSDMNYMEPNGNIALSVVIISVSIGITMVMASLFLAFRYRSHFATKTITRRLNELGKVSITVDETSKTLSTSKTVAVSLPGHLLLDNPFSKIRMKYDNLKSGGTAKVHKGVITDAVLIEKYGIVDVAVKEMSDKDAPLTRDSFLYEVALMSVLPESPYLIKLLAFSLNPMIIVMRFYGLSMQDCLDSPTFFCLTLTRLQASLDVSRGLYELHNKDIIHFDMKPGNILLDYKSQTQFNFLICDFGFADFGPEAERQFVAGMKKPSAIGITRRYAAPELYSRTFDASEQRDFKKVDIYACAMIFYYIWFDTKPWSDEDGLQIESKVLAGERPSFPDSNQDQRLEIKSLINTCWRQDPEERPNIKDIISKLENECSEFH